MSGPADSPEASAESRSRPGLATLQAKVQPNSYFIIFFDSNPYPRQESLGSWIE